MRRPIAILLAWLAVSLSIARAVPARPLYEPPPPQRPPVLDFRGAHWFGKTYEQKDWHIVFHEDGAVTNTDNGREHKRSGTWKANGNSIYLELHSKYYEFNGIVSGDVLHGDSKNVAGLRWKTTLQRIPPK